MLHNITLDKEKFDQLDNVLITEDTGTFEKNDTLVLTCEGTRDQKVKYIQGNYIEKVHKGWCYLYLSENRGVDDVPATVGSGSAATILHEMLNEDENNAPGGNKLVDLR